MNIKEVIYMEIIKISETETLYKIGNAKITVIKGKSDKKIDVDKMIRINRQIIARQQG